MSCYPLLRRGLLLLCSALIAGTVCLSPSRVGATPVLPHVFLLDPQLLMQVKTAIQSGSTQYSEALNALRRQAKAALKLKPPSVMDKAQIPAERR